MREAEFVSPRALRSHYTRIVEGYIDGTRRRPASTGEVGDIDPTVAAWALMGIGEMIGMRWVLWGDSHEVPAHVFDEVIALIRRALESN